MPGVILDHFTINVAELDRSTRFYCEGLGFDFVEEHVVGDEGAGPVLLEPPYRVRSRHLLGGGIRLILNLTEIPEDPLPAYRRGLGLTNFAVRVPDLEQSRSRLESLGGRPVETSRASFPFHGRVVEVIVVLDPDGFPIELVEGPAEGP